MDAQRLTELLRRAMALSGAERATFLDDACGDDAALRGKLEGLLAQQESSTRVGADEPAADEPAPAAAAARRIGPYAILGTLGEGGMGVVYLAEQDNPKRTIALKVIRPGLLTPSLLRRFEHESEVLGRLQHPGIAQIYAAGTADGMPYFAMEHVKGVPLGDHVASEGLDVPARLRLVIRMCDAVHHAHQKGIVHRDLKPANILVDQTGQPKILDFGIARVTDSDLATATMQTDTGQLVGTVPYMSPEQVAADPNELDTRSDVYTLGVILYELLSGRLPHDVRKTAIVEAARLITETEPPALGALDRRFRGDLQTIAGKALEKDKTRRYQSAAELAADIRRHLDDEPISARPPTTSYQLAKFARRNKGLVAGLAAAFLILVAGVIATTFYAFRAEERRVAAEEAQRQAEAAEEETARARDAAVAAQETAETEAAIAKATRDFLINMLKSIDPEVALGREITVRELIDDAAAGASFPGQPRVEAEVRNVLSQAYRGLGRHGDGLVEAEKTLVAAREEWGDDDVNTVAALRNVAIFLRDQAKYERSEKLTKEALAILRRIAGDDHQETAMCTAELASLYMETGRLAQAAPLYLRAIEVGAKTLGARHDEVMATRHNYGTLLNNLGRFAEAEQELREVLTIRMETKGPEHSDTAATLHNLGNSLDRLGRHAEAERSLREAARIREHIFGRDHQKTLVCLMNLANALVHKRDYAQAETLIREVVTAYAAKLGDAHPNTLSALNTLAYILEDTQRDEEAEKIYRRVVAARMKSGGGQSPETWPPMNNLAMLLQRLGKLEEADTLFREVLALCDRNLPPGHFLTVIFRNNHGDCLTDMKRYADAERALLATLPALKKIFKRADHPRVVKARGRLRKLYVAWGKPDLAAKFKE